MRTLLVVDVQNDFCEGGALGVPGGRRVAEEVERYLARDAAFRYDRVIASRDLHRANHDNGGHFAAEGAEPDFVTSFPAHCVEGTPGAGYAFDPSAVSHHVTKGWGEPAFSLLEGFHTVTLLAATIFLAPYDELDVCGLATDYCVKATVLDAMAQDTRVTLLADLVAGVSPQGTRDALGDMVLAGANVRNVL